MRAILLACALLFAGTADAKVTYDNDGRISVSKVVGKVHRHERRAAHPVRRHDGVRSTEVVGRRPAGCPTRYCGCEASLLLFGKIVPELNLAANWIRKFPKTRAAPHMVAARPGHVMVLLAERGRDRHGYLQWLVHDGNSGGGRTRVHVRSLRGFAIVNPHGAVARL